MSAPTNMTEVFHFMIFFHPIVPLNPTICFQKTPSNPISTLINYRPHLPSGAVIPAPTNMTEVSQFIGRFAPTDRPRPQPPWRMALHTIWVVTNDDEHAVSMLTLGPCKAQRKPENDLFVQAYLNDISQACGLH